MCKIAEPATNIERSHHKRHSKNYKLRKKDVLQIRLHCFKELEKMYEFGALLGEGAHACVKELKERRSKKVLAVKIVDRVKAENLMRGNLIKREIEILKLVNHPHIVFLDIIYELNKTIYLVQEKYNTDLALLLKKKKLFSEEEARIVLQELADAVSYLHHFGIIHRDLKLQNILTAKNPDKPQDELYIKIIDFSLSMIKPGIKHDETFNLRCGTLPYMSPEMIKRTGYNEKCDVWSMGVLLYALLYGKYPFHTANGQTINETGTKMKIEQMICDDEPNFKCVRPVSSPAINLLQEMLSKNPNMRIAASDIEYHPWVQGQ